MSRKAESVPPDAGVAMRSYIQRIATGPEMSKDLSQEEARHGMQLILEKKVDPVQAGIFLIALRMKRETRDENLGVLQALLEVTHTATAAVDEVLTVVDPYDGYNRTLPAAPFLPAVLAACGVPTVTHGVATMGPKYGVTHHQVLRAAGVPVDLSPQQAAERLSGQGPGWAYVDQSRFCPPLHELTGLRTQIVKRPVITTTEVVVAPVRGRLANHLMTGYVHKPYPPIYAMLARAADFDSALIVRGVEGGVIPSLGQAARLFHYHRKGEEAPLEVDPTCLGIDQPVRAVPIPEGLPETTRKGDEIAVTTDTGAVAQAAAEAGLEALGGKPGATRDSLIYGASLALHHLRRFDELAQAARAVGEVLDSGAALRRVTPG